MANQTLVLTEDEAKALSDFFDAMMPGVDPFITDLEVERLESIAEKVKAL